MLSNYQPYQDNEDPYLQERYDSEQVQKRIEQSDAWIATGVGIAQGTILSGVQLVSVQYLYDQGQTGLYPLGVGAIPVAIAFGIALNTVTIDNGFSVSDLGKFGAGLALSGMLTCSSAKLYLDNQRAESIAKEGIATIKKDLDVYEGRKDNSNFLGSGFMLLVALGVGIAIASALKNRRK
jgi:hypothetical protein